MNVFYPKIHQVITVSEQANWDTGYLQGNILQVSYTGCNWSILSVLVRLVRDELYPLGRCVG